MDDALDVGRLQFAFTVTYHYLFPQLSMGLALLVFVFKTLALRTGGDEWTRAARFWTRILALNFVMGVVTGIPMEFQFGTNWSRFAEAAGGVIGQTLAMEGTFAFFLESTFLGLLLFGEKRLSQRAHWAVAGAVFAGAWLSGYFIVCTNAWMQHPVGYTTNADGEILLRSFWALLLNPWAIWQYLHVMAGTVATAAFVVAGIGAYYTLGSEHASDGRTFLRVAVPAGFAAAVLLAMPTGDMQARLVARHKPVAFASMEGIFHTETDPGLVILGQPDVENMRLDNPLVIPKVLGFLTYNRFGIGVKGLADFPREDWPDNIALHYYAYHVMVGLGTMFIALMAVAGFLQWRGRLASSRPVLWALMLATPFPYIANTAGWMTSELGRQPWLIYGLMRTEAGNSPLVSAGNAMFTLIGFAGMYLILGILFLFLVAREIGHGPAATATEGGH